MTEWMDASSNKTPGRPCSPHKAIKWLPFRNTAQYETNHTSARSRPRPGRRRRENLFMWSLTWSQCWTLVTLIFSILCADVEALSRRKEYGRFIRSEEIIFDRSPPPQLELLRRGTGVDPFQPSQDKASPSSASTNLGAMTTAPMRAKFSSPATAIASSATGDMSIVIPKGASTSSSAAATSIVSAPAGSSSLPKAFDGGIGKNFTESTCPVFLNSFLNNETFTQCMPFSLFLQTSMSFFASSKTLSSISHVLDSSCKVVFPTCSSLMSSLARELKSNSNCGADLRLENPIVQQAYNGLIAYAPLYQASCLKGSSMQHYCFANAVTNMSNPSDTYTYYLALGMPLPSGSMLTCSDCLKNTMEIFREAASNSSQPVSKDYSQAAQMIDLSCGPQFVNTTVERQTSAGSSSIPSLRAGILVAVLTVLAGFAL